MEDLKRIEIPINLKDNKSSNLFLRKAFSLLMNSSNFMTTPTKDAKKNIIVLGVLSFGGNNSIGVSCKYEKKGCIKSLIFDNVESGVSNYIKSMIEEALIKYKDTTKEIKIGYQFESSTHYIKPILSGNFEISVNEDYSNSISFKGKGYDIDDIFNFNKYILESILDCLSIYYNIPFDTRHILSDRFRSIPSPRELINTDPNFVKYKAIELDHFIIKVIEIIITLDKEDFDKLKIFKMTRLFRDGCRIEYYGFNGLSINFKEIAHSIYMSCLEVMSKGKGERCEICGQEKFKISQRISDLIYELSKSEELRKFIKNEYGKRSRFLHLGSYFSSNSLVTDKYIPQLGGDSEHGHILQVNHFNSLDFIKELLRALFIKEFDNPGQKK